MNLQDLIYFITDSNLKEGEKIWLTRNLQHVEDKFEEKYGKTLEI